MTLNDLLERAFENSRFRRASRLVKTVLCRPRMSPSTHRSLSVRYRLLLNILFLGLCTPAGFAQNPQKVVSGEQTTFSAEEDKFEHPVPLNESAKKALASEQGIADVLKDEKLSVETMPEDWFTASEVHLSNPAEVDLVVMGNHIARGAYTSAFWVLRKSPEGYRVVFRNDAHDLQLLDTKTSGLRNILTDVITLRYGSTAEYAFDGTTYKIVKRTLQPNDYAAHPNPAKYRTRRAFIQLSGQDQEPILAKARAWIWQRWRAEESSYVRVSTHDDDGEEQDCLYFIDNHSENGEMQVTLKIHRIAWDQDSPSGPRYKVMEDQIVIANQVQRTEPSEDDSQTPKVLSEKEELPSSKYRLHFLDDGMFDLLTL